MLDLSSFPQSCPSEQGTTHLLVCLLGVWTEQKVSHFVQLYRLSMTTLLGHKHLAMFTRSLTYLHPTVWMISRRRKFTFSTTKMQINPKDNAPQANVCLSFNVFLCLPVSRKFIFFHKEKKSLSHQTSRN